MTFFRLAFLLPFSFLLTASPFASAQQTDEGIQRNLAYIKNAGQLNLSPVQVGRLWAELAHTYHEQLQYPSAEAAYTHALALFEHDPAAARDYATTLSNLGALYCDTGRLDAAERIDLRSLAVAQKLGDSLRLAHAEGQLSQLYLEQRSLKKAAEYSLKASEDFTRTPDGGGVNRALALVVHTYATCEKRCDEGLRSAQQAMELLRAQTNPDSIAVGQTYIALGFTEQQAGAKAKAGDDMREGVRILEQNIRPNDARLIAALKLYRKYLTANHRYGEAAEIAARVEAANPPQPCASCAINAQALR